MTPGAAGPWMWAAVSPLERPLKVMLKLRVLATVFTVIVANPVPTLPLSGTS